MCCTAHMSMQGSVCCTAHMSSSSPCKDLCVVLSNTILSYDMNLCVVQAGMRTGIMGIERNIEKKQRETGREVSQVCTYEQSIK